MEEKTDETVVETIKHNDEEIHLWQGEEGWYSCRSGYTNGLYSESEDLGPYPTREEALEEQLIDIDEFNAVDPEDKWV